MIHFERLDNAITWSVEHPDESDLRIWFRRTGCTTTACLAGTLAIQAGWTPAGWHRWHHLDDEIAVQVAKDGERDSVSAVAAQLLGLHPIHDRQPFTALFYADNLAAVIDVRNRLAREAGVPERIWSLS